MYSVSRKSRPIRYDVQRTSNESNECVRFRGRNEPSAMQFVNNFRNFVTRECEHVSFWSVFINAAFDKSVCRSFRKERCEFVERKSREGYWDNAGRGRKSGGRSLNGENRYACAKVRVIALSGNFLIARTPNAIRNRSVHRYASLSIVRPAIFQVIKIIDSAQRWDRLTEVKRWRCEIVQDRS